VSEPLGDRLSVVVLTHERRAGVLETLAHLRAAAPGVRIVVVDNGSRDGTAAAVRRDFGDMSVVALPENVGAAARNAGVRATWTRFVAFCDDDTWWAPGALERAADVLDRFPALGVVTARVLVEPLARDDPTNALMAASPLDDPLGVPGTAILGFMAGACAMRRAAFDAAGGYEPRFFIGAEETLLAIDLAVDGWSMAYLPDVVVHHAPSQAGRDAVGRERLLLRNRLWAAWMRRPARGAFAATGRAIGAALRDPRLAPALPEAVLGAAWALRRRRVVPAHVEAALARIEDAAHERDRARDGTLAVRLSGAPPARD
jgi:GT2 family glycosyltransferase